MMNMGDMLDTIAARIDPAATAIIHGERTLTWPQLAVASNRLARAVRDGGAQPGDKLAIYLRNGPEYLIALCAALKARLVPVNVNYRYASAELAYLFDNADARVVVYGAEFRPRIAEVRPGLNASIQWIEAGDAPVAEATASFGDLTGGGDGSPLGIARSPDDLFFIYTGGTTGSPKGVMWPQGDLHSLMVGGLRGSYAVPDTLEELATLAGQATQRMRALVAPPLMHGTGLIVALNALLLGGSVVTLESAGFDPAEMLRAIDRHRPDTLVIVGDSFARPLLRELVDHPGDYDLGSVTTITSSGVMWSLEVKRGLLDFMPGAQLNDVLSSSEALGLGASVMTAGGEVATARFAIGPRCRVLGEDGRFIASGTAGRGMLALGPPNPLGYYKDPEKSAATLREIDGERYCIPGDWVDVAADGTLTFLGRGNACINTGGEKVFAEEVEEVLKRHAGVADALVVGVPDERWGNAIVAVVTPQADVPLDEERLRGHVRAHLAGYKVPKAIVAATTPLRAANGKADYAAARTLATQSWSAPA
ncbi:AMP-binding protein [uncultured Sphingomonas sp.]|uniref:AMP-binding protein n=1 Tax=uncultured Sphingomonas sp. TaxID=158754 RepID=UPI0030DACE95